jgi:hypothetical protein
MSKISTPCIVLLKNQYPAGTFNFHAYFMNNAILMKLKTEPGFKRHGFLLLSKVQAGKAVRDRQTAVPPSRMLSLAALTPCSPASGGGASSRLNSICQATTMIFGMRLSVASVPPLLA